MFTLFWQNNKSPQVETLTELNHSLLGRLPARWLQRTAISLTSLQRLLDENQTKRKEKADEFKFRLKWLITRKIALFHFLAIYLCFMQNRSCFWLITGSFAFYQVFSSRCTFDRRNPMAASRLTGMRIPINWTASSMHLGISLMWSKVPPDICLLFRRGRLLIFINTWRTTFKYLWS